MDNIKFSEFTRLSKFIYNKIDYYLFKESILAAVEDADENYIEEKWRANKNNLHNFYAFYDERSYNYIYNKMRELNYN